MRLHNLVRKVPLLLILLLTFTANSFGAPQATGPDEVKAGELVKISVSEIADLNDPKFQCVPDNVNWFAVKSFDGQAMILFATTKPGTYTFSMAGNKDNKTFAILKQVKVIGSDPGPPTPPGPVPPNPPPVPPDPIKPGKYTSMLSAPYMVSPDNTRLLKLIGVYEAMAAQAKTITNYKQMMSALADSAKEALGGETPLRGVRDKVAEILQDDLANRGSAPYDAKKTEAIFTEIAFSLMPLVK
jgi:hypothetical protein